MKNVLSKIKWKLLLISSTITFILLTPLLYQLALSYKSQSMINDVLVFSKSFIVALVLLFFITFLNKNK
ncbi:MULTISPECIES: hypothetical protein [Flavobacterium]|uniref:Uncharacterized protein n=1 Tax=Flavobacterium jumunjinense TaxID=998845 RepID=A0ABV5GUE1_9FLAO|nr:MULTISPECIES: hypothetical protein [Flavobacterium]